MNWWAASGIHVGYADNGAGDGDVDSHDDAFNCFQCYGSINDAAYSGAGG